MAICHVSDDVLALLDYTEEEMENLREDVLPVTTPETPNQETVTVQDNATANVDNIDNNEGDAVKNILHTDSINHLLFINDVFALNHRENPTAASEGLLRSTPASRKMIMTVMELSHVLQQQLMYLFIYNYLSSSFLPNHMQIYSRTHEYNVNSFNSNLIME